METHHSDVLDMPVDPKYTQILLIQVQSYNGQFLFIANLHIVCVIKSATGKNSIFPIGKFTKIPFRGVKICQKKFYLDFIYPKKLRLFTPLNFKGYFKK